MTHPRIFTLLAIALLLPLHSAFSETKASASSSSSSGPSGSVSPQAADASSPVATLSEDELNDDQTISEGQEVSDPLEPFNRKMFWFNDKLDTYLLEPVARGYNAVVPDPAQDCVRNFFRNLGSPMYLVSDLLQLKFKQMGQHTARFVINTTVGLAGLFDVAENFNLPYRYEDFGVGLGYQGVGEGPYIVLPLLGPSNARDALGRIVDAFLDPFYYTGAVVHPSSAALAVTLSGKSVDTVQTRADLLEAIKSGKETSLDFYLFTQSTYHQIRQNYIYDDHPPENKGELSLDDKPKNDQ